MFVISLYLIISTFFLLVIFLIGFLFFFRYRRKKQLLVSLEMVLFRVKTLKYEKYEKKEGGGGTISDPKSLIGAVEQLYSHFLLLPKKIRPRIVFEIASEVGGEDIAFYIAVPISLEKNIEKIIHSIYSNAIIEKVPQDYTIFEPKAKIAASFLMLKKSFYLPLTTYKSLEKDPLISITHSLSKILPEEGAAIQIILKPINYEKKRIKAEKIISEMKQGHAFTTVLSKIEKNKILKILNAFIEVLVKKEGKESIPTSSVDEMTIQAIQNKIQKPLMEVNIRLLAVGLTLDRVQEILFHLETSFFQFSSVFNEFSSIRVKKRKLRKIVYNFSFRNFNRKEKIILNLEEISSIFHFPISYIEGPHIKWIKTKEILPPMELPATGSILIGNTVYRQEQKPVFFASTDDRRRHFYLIGQTGTGKTSLLQEMIRQDIQNGEGVGVIEPHGDLIEAILANIPEKRVEDVVLFESFNTAQPCGLNMLEWETPEQKDFAISEMITIFSKLFPPEIIGPMFEHYMRNAMLTLMADKKNPGTLVEIPRIFIDEDFLKIRLKKVTDFLVRDFWEKEWAQTVGSTRSDMLGYVVSKVGRFIENEMMRNIIGQSFSSFDLSKIMNEGKIFLANLSKGLTGELNSSLLGLILVSKMQIAAMRRANIPQEQRKDFYLYIDEFQNFTTDSIATILSEARKYRLNLILAHQFIPQLTQEIRNAVIGNVGTLAAFRVGADDAEFLEKIFEPEFSKFDLLNLDNFQFIIRMMIRNHISSPFKVLNIKPHRGYPEIVESIKTLSKLKYGRLKKEVEEDIIERMKLKI